MNRRVCILLTALVTIVIAVASLTVVIDNNEALFGRDTFVKDGLKYEVIKKVLPDVL